MKLVEALPKNAAGRAIGNQLIRCGTSIGANYRAACRGRSRADFLAKLGLVEEEADESGFWLELIIEGNLLKKPLVEPLLKKRKNSQKYSLPPSNPRERDRTMKQIQNLKSKI